MPSNRIGLIESIRTRTSMYVGDTASRGFHELAFTVFDECVAELLSGCGTHFSVCLHKDGSLEVGDDGRPTSTTPLTEFEGLSRFEIAFTHREAAPTYRGSKRYKVGTGGLHGLNLVLVNALSEHLEAQTGDGQAVATIRFQQGRQVSGIATVIDHWRGFKVRFKPDPTIFPQVSFEQARLVTRLVELAALNPGMTIDLRDELSNESLRIQFNDGVSGLVRLMSQNLWPAYGSIISINHNSETLRLNIAFRHVQEAECRSRGYVNSIHTVEGGTHWNGFIAGLRAALKAHMDEPMPGQLDQLVEQGLTAVVSIWVDDPTFEGPTRTKFALSQLKNTVKEIVEVELAKLFTTERSTLSQIIDRQLSCMNTPRWTLAEVQRVISLQDDVEAKHL